MKRIFGGLVLLTILGLAACDTIPSDAILNAEALAQTNEISLADVDGTDEPLAVVVGHTYDITFWPDPNIAQDIEAEWDFGVSYEFDHSEDSTVRFLAFGMYEDEPEASANRDVCETTQSIPSAYPERPFWSTGTPTEYPAGRHRFEQSYHYPGGEEMAGINHIVVWLIHQQGSITGCHVRQYIVSAQTNYGDVNGDGEVNITDALMVAR
ncbi:MAG: hypothetical protein JXB30_18310, partial [Anaerolineae bacterium]|nr:hypothetical protein [Anaerolineae bacterium]